MAVSYSPMIEASSFLDLKPFFRKLWSPMVALQFVHLTGFFQKLAFVARAIDLDQLLWNLSNNY